MNEINAKVENLKKTSSLFSKNQSQTQLPSFEIKNDAIAEKIRMNLTSGVQRNFTINQMSIHI